MEYVLGIIGLLVAMAFIAICVFLFCVFVAMSRDEKSESEAGKVK